MGDGGGEEKDGGRRRTRVFERVIRLYQVGQLVLGRVRQRPLLEEVQTEGLDIVVGCLLSHIQPIKHL